MFSLTKLNIKSDLRFLCSIETLICSLSMLQVNKLKIERTFPLVSEIIQNAGTCVSGFVSTSTSARVGESFSIREKAT